MFDIFEEYSEDELKLINYNFAFLELLKKDDDYNLDRGARHNKVWNYIHTDGSEQKVIEELYEYTWEPEIDAKKRNANYLSKKAVFYKADGSVGFERPLKSRGDSFYLEGVNRDIRHNRIDYLKSEVKIIKSNIPYMTASIALHYTEVITSIKFILNHYNALRLKYIEDGEMDFETALLNESDTDILGHLNKTTIFPGQDPKWPNGQTIKTAILYQLNGDI